MCTLILNNKIAPFKQRAGIVFINDGEGVNDLDEISWPLISSLTTMPYRLLIDIYLGAIRMQNPLFTVSLV